MKIPIKWTPLSGASWIISINDWTAVSMHFPFLKPFWASVKILLSYNKGINLLNSNLSSSFANTDIDIGL